MQKVAVLFSAVFLLLVWAQPWGSATVSSNDLSSEIYLPLVQKQEAQWIVRYEGFETFDVLRLGQSGALLGGSLDGRPALMQVEHTAAVAWVKSYARPIGPLAEAVDGSLWMVGGLPEATGVCEIHVHRLTAQGEPVAGKRIVWERPNYCQPYDVVPAADGGVLILTEAWEPTPAPWLLRLDAAGEVVFASRLRTLRVSWTARSVAQTADGNWLLAVTDDEGALVLTAVGDDGMVQWQRAYRSAGADALPLNVAVGADGRIFVLGANRPEDGGWWTLALDETGGILWQMRLVMEIGRLTLEEIAAAPDGGVVLAGREWTFYDEPRPDVLVVKLTETGEIAWQRAYGGAHDGLLHAMAQGPGGEILLAAEIGHANWYAKLDPLGQIGGCGIVEEAMAREGPVAIEPSTETVAVESLVIQTEGLELEAAAENEGLEAVYLCRN